MNGNFPTLSCYSQYYIFFFNTNHKIMFLKNKT
jgi:hypothetical protein